MFLLEGMFNYSETSAEKNVLFSSRTKNKTLYLLFQKKISFTSNGKNVTFSRCFTSKFGIQTIAFHKFNSITFLKNSLFRIVLRRRKSVKNL